MTFHQNLDINQLKTHAPESTILAFRPENTGSPLADWCRHLKTYERFRRELEEFAILGDTVLRICDGVEPAPIDQVKILSVEFALKALGNLEDAKEFIRVVRAIASPDASSFELEKIAAFYYAEIRRDGDTSRVLKEMGLLGMEMEAVTATVAEREIDFSEVETGAAKHTVADRRRIRQARRARTALPALTPNYDEEFASVLKRIGRSRVTRLRHDEFAEFYLADDQKSVEELDADYLAYEKLDQFDENGLVGFSMNDGQRVEVVYDFAVEVDSSYLPLHARQLAAEINLIFVGYGIGGAACQRARRFIIAESILRAEIQAAKNGFPSLPQRLPEIETISRAPLTDSEFSEWLASKLEEMYPHRIKRSVRRYTMTKRRETVEYESVQEINPDFDEMRYVETVCHLLWAQSQSDFHLRSLRTSALYQELYLEIRRATDTAQVAGLKKRAYDEFKVKNTLSLKQFTALNTVAKSQTARLANHLSPVARATIREIETAGLGRLKYFKYFLYNDDAIQSLPRQDKQRLWNAVREREACLQAAVEKIANRPATRVVRQPQLFRDQPVTKQIVRIRPERH